MVTGRFTLKPDPTTTNYILYLLVPGFSSSWGCQGRELRGMINVYNLLLYIVATTSATLLPLPLYIELLADSYLMLQDSSEDASLRHAEHIPSYPCTHVLQSTIQPPLSI